MKVPYYIEFDNSHERKAIAISGESSEDVIAAFRARGHDPNTITAIDTIVLGNQHASILRRKRLRVYLTTGIAASLVLLVIVVATATINRNMRRTLVEAQIAADTAVDEANRLTSAIRQAESEREAALGNMNTAAAQHQSQVGVMLETARQDEQQRALLTAENNGLRSQIKAKDDSLASALRVIDEYKKSSTMASQQILETREENRRLQEAMKQLETDMAKSTNRTPSADASNDQATRASPGASTTDPISSYQRTEFPARSRLVENLKAKAIDAAKRGDLELAMKLKSEADTYSTTPPLGALASGSDNLFSGKTLSPEERRGLQDSLVGRADAWAWWAKRLSELHMDDQMNMKSTEAEVRIAGAYAKLYGEILGKYPGVGGWWWPTHNLAVSQLYDHWAISARTLPEVTARYRTGHAIAPCEMNGVTWFATELLRRFPQTPAQRIAFLRQFGEATGDRRFGSLP